MDQFLQYLSAMEPNIEREYEKKNNYGGVDVWAT
jgi:hypothetical protein